MSPISVVFFLGKHLSRLPKLLWNHVHLPVLVTGLSVVVSVSLKLYWLWIVVLGVIISLLLFLLLLAAFLTYIRFRYKISDDVIVVREGVFRVVQTDVPWSQVRAINMRRNFVERLTNLATISVDTAGTSTAEVLIPALGLGLAESLRDKVAYVSQDPDTEAKQDTPSYSLYRIAAKDLLLASFCSSGAIGIVVGCVFFGSLFLFCSLIAGLGTNLDPSFNPGLNPINFFTQGMARVIEQFHFGFLTVFRALEQTTGIAMTRSWFLMLVSTIGILIVAVLFFYSVLFVLCFISNFNLHLQRRKDGLSISRGLFTTRYSSLSSRKIQTLSLRMNFREVLFQIGELVARQSTSGRDHRLVIPSCPAHIQQQVRDEILGNIRSRLRLQPNAQEIKPISLVYLFQVFFNHLVAMLIVLVATTLLFLLANDSPVQSLWWLLWIPMGLIIACICWRKAGYAWDSEMVLSKRGLLGYKLTLGRLGKVQYTSIKQNAIQRLTGKSTLTLYFATRNIEVPYIKLSVARQVADYVLHFVETKEIFWE